MSPSRYVPLHERITPEKLRELEAKSIVELAGLSKEVVRSIEESWKDDPVKNAIVKTAEIIVASVMRENAGRINETIASMVRDMVEKRLGDIGALIDERIREVFQGLDDKGRTSFLSALDEVARSSPPKIERADKEKG